MVKIAKNSVLFQLNALSNLPAAESLSHIKPLSRDDLAQAHDAWARNFSSMGGRTSIAARQQPFNTRAVTSLITRVTKGDESALDEIAALGEPAIDSLTNIMRRKILPRRHAAIKALGRMGSAGFEPLATFFEANGGTRPSSGYLGETEGHLLEALLATRDPRVDPLFVQTVTQRPNARRGVHAVLARQEFITFGDQAIDELSRYLDSHETAYAEEVIMGILCEIGSPRAMDALFAQTREGKTYYRCGTALRWLGKAGDQRAVELARKWLEGEDEDLYRCAVETLQEIGDSRAVEPLIAFLRSEPVGSKGLLAYAINVLAMIGDARAVEPLIAFLREGIDDLGSVKPLGACLRSEPAPISIRAAINALAKIGGARAVEPLIECLDNDWIDESAAEALVRIGDSRGMRALFDLKGGFWVHSIIDENLDAIDAQDLAGIVNDEDRSDWIQRYALGLLGRQKNPCIDLIVAALDHRNDEIQTEAAEILGRIGGERAIGSLKEKLADGSADVCSAAFSVLKKIPNAFTMEDLVGLLHHSNDKIMHYALGRLRQDGTAVVEPLVDTLTSTDDVDVRDGVQGIVARFAKEDARDALLAAWQNGDASARSRLLYVVGKILGDEGADLWVSAMDDEDVKLRMEITFSLKSWWKDPAVKKNTPAINALIARLSDEEAEIRKLAADALGLALEQEEVPQVMDPLFALLNDPAARVRYAAAYALRSTKDPRVTDVLLAVLDDPDADYGEAIEALGQIGVTRAVEGLLQYLVADESHLERTFRHLNSEIADTLMLRMLDNLGSLSGDAFKCLERLAKRKDLPRAEEIINSIAAERAREENLRAELEEKYEEVIAAIRDKIAQVMGFETSVDAGIGANGSYGSISFGQSMRLELRSELRTEMQPDNSLRIDPGESIEEARERMRTLNFLVHHEMGHLIQKKKSVPEPKVNTGQFSLLDAEQVKHDANEMVIDRLAFEAARQIYVYGAGDLLLEEDQREAIAVRAYFTLAGIILRKHQHGTHEQQPETLARVVAVLMELANSKDILLRTKKAGLALAEKIYNEIVGDRDDDYGEQIANLIKAYRRIFLKTRLPR